LARRNTDTAHSLVMSGSLYVEVTIRAPLRFAAATISSGVTGSAGAIEALSRRAWEVSQFWQNPQCMSQPSMPNESALAPGSAW
jgi:hypothetical protein